jgi:hypothetical protein
MRRPGTALVAVAALCAGCASMPQLVSLTRDVGAPLNAPPSDASPLEVVSRATAVRDPLPVRGSDIVYGDLEGALGAVVSVATVPWAQAHRSDEMAARGGWTVLLEVAEADAELEPGGRLVIGIDVHATLRTRRGNVYLGQTQLGCREGGLVSADGGSPVVYRCMSRVAGDLAGWLAGGVPLDPSRAEPG